MAFSFTQLRRFHFPLGIMTGLIIATFLASQSQVYFPRTKHESEDRHVRLQHRDDVQIQHRDDVQIQLRLHNSSGPGRSIGPYGKTAYRCDDSVAAALYEKVRVACWILTSPQNRHKAIAVNNTWARRCNIVLFMSSALDPELPTIALNVSEGRQHLMAKSWQAFKYFYDHHLNDADWFLKADDDTYVIMENLRYMLSEEDPKEPVYFGHRFRLWVKYASGGAGYVISREALRRFGLNGTKLNRKGCANNGSSEDTQMGNCLRNVGVTLKTDLDAKQRMRFHVYNAGYTVQGQMDSRYLNRNMDKVGGGVQNMSDYAVTFHYVGPLDMKVMDYYIYHLQVYGIVPRPQDLNRRPP